MLSTEGIKQALYRFCLVAETILFWVFSVWASYIGAHRSSLDKA